MVWLNSIFFEMFIALALGNLSKFMIHLVFPYEGDALFLFSISSISAIYFFSKRRILLYAISAIGFATHEYWFEQVGWQLGMMYNDYGIDNAELAFFWFLVLAVAVHLLLSGIKWAVDRLRLAKE